MTSALPLDARRIMELIPHRYPFLLIDRLIAAVPNESATALKNVTINENFFQGHFPGAPVMPGVLIIEAMAQVSSLALYPYLAKDIDRLARDFQCVLVGVDGARFRRPVVPGDLLRIESVITKMRGKLWGFQCKATVDGQVVAEADILANLIANGAGA